MAKPKYVVLSRIEGATKAPLKEGDRVDLPADIAAPLLAGKALALIEEPAEEIEKDKK